MEEQVTCEFCGGKEGKHLRIEQSYVELDYEPRTYTTDCPIAVMEMSL